MTERRPDPDELIARLRDEEKTSTRGKLTIFFGAAPGVGKTYTMLEAARLEIENQHRDVVVGIVETHGRFETGSVLMGLELLPRRVVEHRGIRIEEFDLDAALARHPQLVLVDELAHTNAPASRHPKRWQDVVELLDAGIDVFTTLNVQHLESLNDVVAQITGVVVRETVPDAVFDQAYEVRVVDLPVDQLLERLREGKVYLPEQAARAVQNFFKEGNLIALRELALRRTAERVEAKMRGYKAAHGIEESWHTGERVLVCVSASPNSARLIRAARRMASSLHAELLGVYVETPGDIRMSAPDRARLAENIRLVEVLDGEAVMLHGEDAAVETVRYARKRNATKIVVGKPTHSYWRDVIAPSFLDKLVRVSREIDVYVISGEAHERPPPPEGRRSEGIELSGYVAGATIVATSAVSAWFLFGRTQLTDVVMIFLLGVVVVSMRFGYGPSLLAALLSVLLFDFVFIPPYLSFAVTDFSHFTTFAVMLFVALVISNLTKRIREQVDSSRGRERRTAALYAVSRELGIAASRTAIVEVAARHVHELFAGKVALLLPRADRTLEIVYTEDGALSEDDKDMGVAAWAWQNNRSAGADTDTLPSARGRFVPLLGSRGAVGVLALYPSAESHLDDPDERQLLHTVAGLIGLALERTELAAEARRASLRVETEQLRNALLSSVSHDLRTPLGVITGATSALLEEGVPIPEATRHELLKTAHEEALRLTRLVRNLLDMTRLEAGALKLHPDLQSVEEIIGAALDRLEDRLRGREVRTDVPSDLPLLPFDPILIEQVLINLLENATKYTPPGSPIEVAARVHDADVEVSVSDRGAGISKEHAERVFDKFYRVHEAEGGGVGLGLTICRGIVEAHGGRIWVEEREGGGASFHFTLPRGAAAPQPVPVPELSAHDDPA
jgi:two-component system sensor histidine kinase KdpD